MNPSRFLLLSVILWALDGAEAKAHFLFIHIGPPAEAGRAAEVYFSERAEAGDPRFIDNIAHTQLWVQEAPGQLRALKIHKAADRLRAHLPGSGATVVVGTCQYGVIARPKKVPFLLRYYPKAIAGNPEELNRMKACSKVPLEIMTAAGKDLIAFTALRNGKPVPKAVFHTVSADLVNEELTADGNGQATWKPQSPGRYSVYTQTTIKEAGEVDGIGYEEIREFATLAFAWPLERKGADPEAVALFQEAIAARAQWKDFPGFTARIVGQVDGRPFEGKFTLTSDAKVRLETEEKAVRSWVKGQLESIAMHRGAGSEAGSSSDQSKPVLRFAEARDDHPLGRLLIFEGGAFASSYRVKEKQLMVVNRHVGRNNMTITVLDNERNAEGLFLPRSYTVQYWDDATGELRRIETVQERWQRVGSWDLPASHTVTIASEGGLAVRTFTLADHQLIKKGGK